MAMKSANEKKLADLRTVALLADQAAAEGGLFRLSTTYQHKEQIQIRMEEQQGT